MIIRSYFSMSFKRLHLEELLGFGVRLANLFLRLGIKLSPVNF